MAGLIENITNSAKLKLELELSLAMKLVSLDEQTPKICCRYTKDPSRTQ